MFKSNDKKLYISICCLLVILFVVGIVFLVNKTNNTETVKKNTEQFADVKPLSSDELLKKLKSNPDGLQEVISLNNLTETITEIFNSKISENMSKINEEMGKLKTKDVLNNLPKGTIIMWNETDLPSDKWKWCDGSNSTPNLKYRFPLGGKTYGGEEGKPKGENNGLIEEINVPKHRHPLNGEGENEKFPELSHNHGDNTFGSGSHTHNVTVATTDHDRSQQLLDLNKNKGDIFRTFKKDGKTSDTKVQNVLSIGNHTHRINTSLKGTDNEIKNHIVGEGPIYNEDEDQKPFYPHYTLINFIMKVE
tara:strand:+ start:750 stop:1667 length:918 start_codon:yes stop_codon:yes gene_type:complete